MYVYHIYSVFHMDFRYGSYQSLPNTWLRPWVHTYMSVCIVYTYVLCTRTEREASYSVDQFGCTTRLQAGSYVARQAFCTYVAEASPSAVAVARRDGTAGDGRGDTQVDGEG